MFFGYHCICGSSSEQCTSDNSMLQRDSVPMAFSWHFAGLNDISQWKGFDTESLYILPHSSVVDASWIKGGIGAKWWDSWSFVSEKRPSVMYKGARLIWDCNNKCHTWTTHAWISLSFVYEKNKVEKTNISWITDNIDTRMYKYSIRFYAMLLMVGNYE